MVGDRVAVTDDVGGPHWARSAAPRWAAYVGAVLGLLVVQRLVSDLGDAAARRVDTRWADPTQWWAPLSVHHLTQGALTLGLLLVCARCLRLDVALRVGDARAGLRAVGWFTLAYGGYLLALYTVRHGLGLGAAVDVPPDAGTTVGYLGFQLLLSGPAEELAFRALPLAVLAAVGPPGRRWRVLDVLVASTLFALAHVTVRAGVVTADPGQLATAFVLGTVQGLVLQRTRSVLYPMAIHSVSNVMAVSAAVLA